MAWKIVYDNSFSAPYLANDGLAGRYTFTRKEDKLVLHIGETASIHWEWIEKLHEAHLAWENGCPTVPLPEGWRWEERTKDGQVGWAAYSSSGACYVDQNGDVQARSAPLEVVRTVLEAFKARRSRK